MEHRDPTNGELAIMLEGMRQDILENHSTTTGSLGKIEADVKTIVQEIVDRAGWVVNNDIRFGFIGAALAYPNFWTFADTGHATGVPATLDITYTAAGGGSTPAPTPILQPISGGVVTSGGGMGL